MNSEIHKETDTPDTHNINSQPVFAQLNFGAGKGSNDNFAPSPTQN